MLRWACEVAAKSHDPHTQNGAVIAAPDAIALVASNQVPAGLWASPDRLTRPAKYDYIEHAERAAIYAAARAGYSTKGARMYCPWFACVDCARGIILAGIREVVGHIKPRSLTPDRWTESIVKAEAMLREAGVGIRWLNDRLGVTILFDGEILEL
jgi:dCMP deaminase